MIFRPLPSFNIDAVVHYKTSAGDKALRVGDTINLSANYTILGTAVDRPVQWFWNTGNGFEPGEREKTTVLNKEGETTIQIKVRSNHYLIRDSVKAVSLNVCQEAVIGIL